MSAALRSGNTPAVSSSAPRPSAGTNGKVDGGSSNGTKTASGTSSSTVAGSSSSSSSKLPAPAGRSSSGASGGQQEEAVAGGAKMTSSSSSTASPRPMRGPAGLSGVSDHTDNLSRQKWDKMMARGLHHFITEQRETFLRRVRRGIPQEHRWAVWKAAVSEQKGISPQIRSSTYRNLVSKENKWHPLIKIDISRTFPETNEFGVEEQAKLLGNISTSRCKPYRNILSAYSNFNMDVGYCQGMNFIAGLLLLVSGCQEEETFWMFTSVMELRGLKGFYREGFPMLRVYLKAFDRLLDEELPGLRNHFRNENVQPAVYLHQWFLTLYINCLPLETVLVIWDVVVCEGLHVLLNITLSLLKVLQSVLLKLEFEDIVKFFKTMKAGDEDCDATMIGQLLIRQSSRIELSSNVLAIISESGALANDADFDDFSDPAEGGSSGNDQGGASGANNGLAAGSGGDKTALAQGDSELTWFEKVGRDIGSFFQEPTEGGGDGATGDGRGTVVPGGGPGGTSAGTGSSSTSGAGSSSRNRRMTSGRP